MARAAVLTQIGKPLEIQDLAMPRLGRGQVHVQIHFAGVCHTQLHEVRGRRGDDRYIPHTLGHEGAGVVLAVGEDVTTVEPGDHVVLSWIKGDGLDAPGCNYGTINSGAVSTFMEEAVVAENRVTAIPKDLPLDLAALLGCAFPTGAGAVINQGQLHQGGSVAIFGIGGVGASAVLGAVMAGAKRIVAIDISEEKLGLAKQLGATHVINARTDDPLSHLSGGDAVDVAIEAAGTRTTMNQALKAARPGGRCIIVGNLATGTTFEVDPFDLIAGRILLGSWGGATEPARDIPRYADQLLSGRTDATLLITRTYELEEINEALDDLEAGKLCRGVIRMAPRG